MVDKPDLRTEAQHWPSQPHIFNFNGEELDLAMLPAGSSVQKDNIILTHCKDGTVTIRSIDGSVKPQRFVYARGVRDLVRVLTPPFNPQQADMHTETHRFGDAEHLAKERWEAAELGRSYEDYVIDKIAQRCYRDERHNTYYKHKDIILPPVTAIGYQTDPHVYYPVGLLDNDFFQKKIVDYFTHHPDELQAAQVYYYKRQAAGVPIRSWEIDMLHGQIQWHGRIYKSFEEYDKMHKRNV